MLFRKKKEIKRPDINSYTIIGDFSRLVDYKNYIKDLDAYCDRIEKALDKTCKKLGKSYSLTNEEVHRKEEEWKEWSLKDD